MKQYRILLNGEQIPTPDNEIITNEKWSAIVDRFESRYSGKIVLQCRDVFDFDGNGDLELFLSGLVNKTGYIHIKNQNRVISPWQTIAEVEVK